MKKLFLVTVSAMSILACNNPASDSQGEKTTDNEKIVMQMFEHFNNHDFTKMAAMYIDSAEFKDPSFGTGIVKKSRQETAAKYADIQSVFTDINDKVVSVYSSGDKHVIVEFVSTGTAPDGSKLDLPIVTIFTIENGMITKDFTYYDNF